MKYPQLLSFKLAHLSPIAGAILLSQAAPVSAFAEDEFILEEIIVTAQRREQSIQKVPMSLTALSENMMAEQGIDDFQDFASRIPGFNLRTQSSVESNITLRGISPMGGSAAPVAIYIDDMPISGIQGNGQPAIKTFDVNRIEVLRGPQGTLYGEGSLGGTIKVIMNKPDATQFAGKFDGTISGTADGGLNLSGNIMLNLPLVDDKLAIRTILNFRDFDGYLDAPNLGKENVNGEKLWGGRISLRWLASEQLTVDLTAIYQDVDLDGRNAGYSSTTVNPAGTVAGTYNARETSISIDEIGNDRFSQYNLTFTYAGDDYQFVSSTSYYDRDTEIARDLAGLIPSGNGVTETNLGGGFNPFVTTITTLEGVGNLRTSAEEIFTQEFRVSYDGTEGLFLQAGAFYKNRKNLVSDFGFSVPDISALIRPVVDLGAGGFLGSYNQNANPLFAIERQDFEQIAIFGEISYDLTEKLTATAGGRYFEESRDSIAQNGGYFIQASVFGAVMGATGNPVAALGAVSALGLPIITENSVKNNEFTWKTNLSYQMTDDHMVYGTVSKGFRAGGVNVFSLANEGLTGMPLNSLPRSYEPDTLINYEIGAKTSWNDGRVTLNGALFLMDWSNVQVNFDPTGLGFPTTINADKARSQGIEVEGNLHLTNDLNVNISAAYTDAKLTSDVILPGNVIGFAKEGRLAGIPKYTFNIGADYSFDLSEDLKGIFRANYSYRDDTVKDPAEDINQIADSYGLVNLSLSIISEGGWQAKAFVNNLTDKVVELDFHSRGEFSTIRPRTIGLNVTVDF